MVGVVCRACCVAVTQPLLLWCVIDTVVAVYMYVHDCGRSVFETGWLSVAMPILLIDTVVAVYMYMTGWLSVAMSILPLPPCRCLSAAPPGGGAALLLSTHTLTPSPLWDTSEGVKGEGVRGD